VSELDVLKVLMKDGDDGDGDEMRMRWCLSRDEGGIYTRESCTSIIPLSSLSLSP